MLSYKRCSKKHLGELSKSLPLYMQLIIQSLSFCCGMQKIGREPINYWNDIVIVKFSIIKIEWNCESFSLFMHLNIKSAIFCCWIPKLDEENKTYGENIVIKNNFLFLNNRNWVKSWVLIVYASQYKVTIILLLDTKSGWRK